MYCFTFPRVGTCIACFSLYLPAWLPSVGLISLQIVFLWTYAGLVSQSWRLFLSSVRYCYCIVYSLHSLYHYSLQSRSLVFSVELVFMVCSACTVPAPITWLRFYVSASWRPQSSFSVHPVPRASICTVLLL